MHICRLCKNENYEANQWISCHFRDYSATFFWLYLCISWFAPLTNEYFFFNYWRQATCVGRCKTFQFTFSYADNSKLSKVRIQKANFLKVPAFFTHEEITFDDLITRYSPWNMIRNPPLWGLDIATGWLKNGLKTRVNMLELQWGPIEIVR